MRRVRAVAVSMVLLAGMLPGQQQQTDWIAASNDPDILFRAQIREQTKACELEYRDQKQGTGYTTFDVTVDYTSTDLDREGKPQTKTDSEHIVTAPSRNGSSLIPNCSAVGGARVSYVQRQ
jgi:hypothetical protein